MDKVAVLATDRLQFSIFGRELFQMGTSTWVCGCKLAPNLSRRPLGGSGIGPYSEAIQYKRKALQLLDVPSFLQYCKFGFFLFPISSS